MVCCSRYHSKSHAIAIMSDSDSDSDSDDNFLSERIDVNAPRVCQLFLRGVRFLTILQQESALAKLFRLWHSGEYEECAICLDCFTDPVATPCAHMYCRACIERYLRSGSSACPLCRAGWKFRFVGAASLNAVLDLSLGELQVPPPPAATSVSAPSTATTTSAAAAATATTTTTTAQVLSSTHERQFCDSVSRLRLSAKRSFNRAQRLTH